MSPWKLNHSQALIVATEALLITKERPDLADKICQKLTSILTIDNNFSFLPEDIRKAEEIMEWLNRGL